MSWLAVSLLAIAGALGVALTLLSLPGGWLLLLVAVVCWWLVPSFDNWWWIGGAAFLAILGEIVEFFSSVLGAKVGGSGRHGAWGAFIGGLVGAIAGTVLIPVPVVGTIAGGVVGAGVLAALFERGGGKRTWRDSSRAGTGAAVGRLFATVLKAAVVSIMGVLLVAGGIWEALEADPPALPAPGMLQPEATDTPEPARSDGRPDPEGIGTDAEDHDSEEQAGSAGG